MLLKGRDAKNRRKLSRNAHTIVASPTTRFTRNWNKHSEISCNSSCQRRKDFSSFVKSTLSIIQLSCRALRRGIKSKSAKILSSSFSYSLIESSTRRIFFPFPQSEEQKKIKRNRITCTVSCNWRAPFVNFYILRLRVFTPVTLIQ